MTKARDINAVTSLVNNMADGKADEERIARLRKRAEETEKMVSQLRQCVEVLRQKAGKIIVRLKICASTIYYSFCTVESSNVPAKVIVNLTC